MFMLLKYCYLDSADHPLFYPGLTELLLSLMESSCYWGLEMQSLNCVLLKLALEILGPA